jgi:hypothetical protein
LPFHRRAELTAADAEAAEIHATGHSGSVERAAKRCCFRLGRSASWAEEWTLAADEQQARQRELVRASLISRPADARAGHRRPA